MTYFLVFRSSRNMAGKNKQTRRKIEAAPDKTKPSLQVKARHRRGLVMSFSKKLLSSGHIKLDSLSQSGQNQKDNLKRALREDVVNKFLLNVENADDYEVSAPEMHCIPLFSNYTEAALNSNKKDTCDAVIALDDKDRTVLYIGKFTKLKSPPKEIKFDSTWKLNLVEFKWQKSTKKISKNQIIMGLSVATKYKKERSTELIQLINNWSFSINCEYYDDPNTSNQSSNKSVSSSSNSYSLDTFVEVKNVETSALANSTTDETKIDIDFPIELNNDGQLFTVDWSYLEKDQILPINLSFDVNEVDGVKNLVPNLTEDPVFVVKNRREIQEILIKDKLAKCSEGGKNSEGGQKRNIGFKPITEPNTTYWICELDETINKKIYQNSIFEADFLEKLSKALNDSQSNDSPSNDSQSNDLPSNDSQSNDSPSNDSQSNDLPSSESVQIEIPTQLQQNIPIYDPVPILLKQIASFREIFEVTLNNEKRPIAAYFSGEIMFY